LTHSSIPGVDIEKFVPFRVDEIKNSLSPFFFLFYEEKKRKGKKA